LPNKLSPELRIVTDLQHTLFKITLDEKLHLAPIKPNPQNVLDVGTGEEIEI
jgi:hypothetical protein